MKTYLQITGMHCANCAQKLQDAFLTIRGVNSAQVDLKSHSGWVESDAPFAFDIANETIKKLGNYTVAPKKTDSVFSAGNRVLRVYKPLIIVFLAIILLTVLWSFYEHATTVKKISEHFMAFFFLVFGALKLGNISQFAAMYATYDLLAMRSRLYALAYPFIEIGLGIFLFFHRYPITVHIFVLLLMTVSALGVAKKLQKKEEVVCACLGSWFKIPLSKVTLYEDVLMAAMAVVVLIDLLFIA